MHPPHATGLIAVLTAVLVLSGCASPDGAGTQGDDPWDERTSVPSEQDATPAGPGAPLTTTHQGTLQWGVRPPLGVALSGPHERFEGTVVDLEVEEDVQALLLELTWADGPAGRPALVLRALSGNDHYWYGGGAGTAADPAWVLIEKPEDLYGVTAIADVAEADVDWTLYATAFHGGGMPEGFTAVA